jgi:hypothetical protein
MLAERVVPRVTQNKRTHENRKNECKNFDDDILGGPGFNNTLNHLLCVKIIF